MAHGKTHHHQAADHLCRADQRRHHQLLAQRQALFGQHRDQVGAQQRGDHRQRGEGQHHRPEHRLAQGELGDAGLRGIRQRGWRRRGRVCGMRHIAQAGVQGRANEKVERRKAQQRLAPAQVQHQPLRQRHEDGAGKARHQGHRDDGLLVAIAKGLAQHDEGRLVQRGRHGQPDRYPHQQESGLVRAPRPQQQAGAGQHGARAHHDARRHAVEQAAHRERAHRPDQQPERIAAGKKGFGVAQRRAHRPDEHGEGEVQRAPGNRLGDAKGPDQLVWRDGAWAGWGVLSCHGAPGRGMYRRAMAAVRRRMARLAARG